jgi:hypothetical protein
MSAKYSDLIANQHSIFWLGHLNKLRWVSLSLVFIMLIAIPYLSVYQNFVAAHAYDLLTPEEKRLYDVIELISLQHMLMTCSHLKRNVYMM